MAMSIFNKTMDVEELRKNKRDLKISENRHRMLNELMLYNSLNERLEGSMMSYNQRLRESESPHFIDYSGDDFPILEQLSDDEDEFFYDDTIELNVSLHPYYNMDGRYSDLFFDKQKDSIGVGYFEGLDDNIFEYDDDEWMFMLDEEEDINNNHSQVIINKKV